MKTIVRKGAEYHLPDMLNDFQLELYIHLIDWKRQNLTIESGKHKGVVYDAILPDELKNQYHPIYRPILNLFLSHQKRFHFKTHKFLGEHMASSQAACANLFLPLLRHPDEAAMVLQSVKPDLRRIATDWFDSGYRIEFWDEPDNMLNDHNPVTGTDADIAIAYYDENGSLNLWLIEHKLSERQFTECGGYKSKNRNRETYRCDSIADIVANRNLCYYHKLGYKYWDITLSNESLFPREQLLKHTQCPFQGGFNQLWRNQLLAQAIEKSQSTRWPFNRVYFSVVQHPKNNALNETIQSYRELLGRSDAFSAFTSAALIEQAKQLRFTPWQEWLDWYQGLYYY